MKNRIKNLRGYCHGITTIGERGQVVIPQEARKALNLKQKDKLFVFSKLDKVVVLVKVKELQNFLNLLVPAGFPLKMVKTIKKTAHKKLKK